VERIGTMHQAGSDSLMTSSVFFKLKDLFKKWWPTEAYYTEQNFNCIIYGLGQSINDDQYIEDYKALTNECSDGRGKIINLNNSNTMGNSSSALNSSSTTAMANAAMNDFL
jgi:hypothetical protein